MKLIEKLLPKAAAVRQTNCGKGLGQLMHGSLSAAANSLG